VSAMTLLDVDSRVLYTGLVALVAVQRLAELRLAERNRARALAAGGFEAESGHYRSMVLLHGLWIAACPLEVWLLDRPFRPALAAAMLLLFALAMALRYWVIRTLGERWTTRIVVLPGAPPITGGPYRYLRHPNYLAVIVELLALPLIHGAWATALLAGVGNALVLRVRIAAEERALAGVSDYGAAFAGRPRLLPGRRRLLPGRRPG
jgi:methyltransferase